MIALCLLGVATVGTVALLIHADRNGMRCWRCGGKTDSRGAPCQMCRAAIHEERRKRLEDAGKLPRRAGP